MEDIASVRVVVYGQVQGVFFRAFVVEKAAELGLKGYARNMPDGNVVEVRAEGDREKLEILLGYLKVGPPSAIVEKIVTDWSGYTGRFSRFNIKY